MTRPQSVTRVLAACLTLLAVSAAAGEGPRLGAGDVLRLSVLGRSEMSGDFAVQPDGRVSLPRLGRLPAAGAAPAELEARIEAALAEAGLDRRPDVTLEVARWREVTVAGDVDRPGGVDWRPGLTVSRAVALAGGERALRGDEMGPALTAIRTLEYFDALRARLAAWRAREARLAEELRLAEAPGFPRLENEAAAPQGSSADGRLSGLIGAEQAAAARFLGIEQARQTALLRQRAALETQLGTLEERAMRLDEEEALLREELGTVERLEGSGLARRPRVLALRRELAELAGVQLEAASEIAEARRRLEDAELALAIFAPTRARETAERLADVRREIVEMEARLDQAGRAADLAAEQAPRRVPPEAAARFTLQRGEGEAAETRPALAADRLLPGDFLRVAAPARD
ncbi:MAG: polysaccharide biosynthesis/export family protein [Pseudomonadota bacterium]